ncbi:GNAT family N-acetyltransferase [Caenispirillum salinarum]|uniref:GNAT family N-acetyltransferase n=1 Tax=Caenispirillum salinarum TaxID=859058 RepID=UPI00384EDF6A
MTDTPSPAFTVRDATDADMDAVTDIYAHHVRHGTGSYEYEPPPVEEMLRRRDMVLEQGLPWLVAATDDGRLLGYAYAALFHGRIGWRFTVEDSVYIAPDAQGQGVGKALLTALIDRCTAAGKRQMIGVVGDADNAGSIALHRACGFEEVGMIKAGGRKFGRWIDTVYMQRALGAGATTGVEE